MEPVDGSEGTDRRRNQQTSALARLCPNRCARCRHQDEIYDVQHENHDVPLNIQLIVDENVRGFPSLYGYAYPGCLTRDGRVGA